MGDAKIRLGTAAVFALCLAVYGATLSPFLPGGDSGELIVVAQHRAVAHPPGYPLWTMLAWLATLIPAASLAWRVAWVSAISAAGAVALTFWCVATQLTRHSASPSVGAVSGALAAGFLAFSPVFWLYATSAEVFALHAFFVASVFALALAWDRSRDPRVALTLAFASGLGLANHLTLVFYLVPIAAWLLWTGRRDLATASGVPRLAIASIAGLLPYAYLWLAGRSEDPYSWGDTGTWSGLVDHLLRRDYGTFQLLPPGHAASSSLPEKLVAYAAHADTALSGVGLVIAAGAIVLNPPRGSFVPLVAGCAFFYLLGFLSLANVAVGDPFLLGVLARFWLQADVAFAIILGIGFGIACAPWTYHARWLYAAVALLLVLHVALGAGDRFHRGDGVVEDYARAILEPLPPGTLLLTHGDLITNSVRYVQSAESVRKDVIVLDQELMTKRWYVRRMAARHPNVAFPGELYHPGEPGGFTMKQLLDANRSRESVAIYPDWKSGDASIDGHWRAWPEGLASRVRPAADAVDPSRWALESAGAIAALEARGWPSIDRYEEGSWERVVLEDVWQARHRRGVLLLTEAIARNNDAGLLTIARGELEAAERVHPDPPAALFKNLGIAYSRLGASQAWLRKEELEAWRRYLEKTDPADPDRATIEAQIRQLDAK